MVIGINTFSSFQFNLFNRQSVQRATVDLQRAGQEAATGRKADVFSDLGPHAANLIKLHGQEANTQTYITSNEVLGTKLSAMLTSVDAARTQLQQVVENVVINATRPQNGAEVLQLQANAALEALISTFNLSFNGNHLFSGLESGKPPFTEWQKENATTGRSPKDVTTAIFGSGPTDAASALTIIDQMDLAFASNDAADPSNNFEETFYAGSSEFGTGGAPAKQVSARINFGQDLVYGVSGNEKAFRDAYKGLAMLAVTDVSKMDEESYSVWMEKVVENLTNAQEGMLDVSARIGFNQQIVDKSQKQLIDVSLVQRTQISNYESVDPYEAVTRMNNLETQLQASYQVTARLSSLSILNFLR